MLLCWQATSISCSFLQHAADLQQPALIKGWGHQLQAYRQTCSSKVLWN